MENYYYTTLDQTECGKLTNHERTRHRRKVYLHVDVCVPLGCGFFPSHMGPAGFQPVCPAAFGLMVHSTAAWLSSAQSNTLLGLVSRIRHINTYTVSYVLDFNIYIYFCLLGGFRNHFSLHYFYNLGL